MRAVLSSEQKQYIEEHPTESAFAMAKKFGCTENTVYYWLWRFHGENFLKTKKENRANKIETVRRLYPTTSAAVIGEKLGLTRSAVCHIAKRLGVKHTDETIAKLHKKSVEMSHTQEASVRRSASITKTLRMDKFRALSGLKQKTKRKFKTVPNRCFCARNYITKRYNYFYDKNFGSLLTIFYDSETNRLPPDRENYYSDKYGIQFLNADE